jgi:hypothetical protein
MAFLPPVDSYLQYISNNGTYHRYEHTRIGDRCEAQESQKAAQQEAMRGKPEMTSTDGESNYPAPLGFAKTIPQLSFQGYGALAFLFVAKQALTEYLCEL